MFVVGVISGRAAVLLCFAPIVSGVFKFSVLLFELIGEENF